MSRFSFSSLRTRCLLLVLVAVVPTLGLTGYLSWEERQREIARAHDNVLRMARLAAAREQRLLDGARQLLLGLAQLPAVREGDAVTCSASFADLLQQYPFYANIGAIKPNGDIFCSAVPLPGPVNVVGRPLETCFQGAVRTRAFALGGYHAGLITGKSVTTLAYPFLDAGGAVQAVVFVALELTWLNQFAADAQLPPGSALTILNHSGLVLARYPAAERWVGQSAAKLPLVQVALRQEKTEAQDLDGNWHILASVPLAGTAQKQDVSVVVGVPREAIAGEADKALAYSLSLLGLIATLGFVAVWVGSDLLVQHPVSVLLTATQRLAAGDLSTRIELPDKAGELGQLARTLNSMATALEQREADRQQIEATVRENEQRLRNILDGLAPSIFIGLLTPEGVLVEASRTALALAGLKREDVIGKPYEETYWLSYAEPVKQQLRAAIQRAARGETSRYEVSVRISENRFLTLDFCLQPLTNEAGRVIYLIPSAVDITDRKQTERALREALQRLRSHVENSPLAVIEWDREFRVRYWSPQAETIFGWRAEEVMGKRPDE
ncbi:MAG: PAS domain S-box protein [Deltaproteobacteria bacterium]|nr:PAS domain S-box protein [Deltaproteobacteria bacterium]